MIRNICNRFPEAASWAAAAILSVVMIGGTFVVLALAIPGLLITVGVILTFGVIFHLITGDDPDDPLEPLEDEDA